MSGNMIGNVSGNVSGNVAVVVGSVRTNHIHHDVSNQLQNKLMIFPFLHYNLARKNNSVGFLKYGILTLIAVYLYQNIVCCSFDSL